MLSFNHWLCYTSSSSFVISIFDILARFDLAVRWYEELLSIYVYVMLRSVYCCCVL